MQRLKKNAATVVADAKNSLKNKKWRMQRLRGSAAENAD
jgi:hypothetical protein